MIETNPTLYQKMADTHVDYSEMYRSQETEQLNKRLRKTRNILLVCAIVLAAGGAILRMMPETPFTTKNFLAYTGISCFIVVLAFYSNRQPYFSILTALIACLFLWGWEIVFNSPDGLLIETSIHKLFIISLLVWRFHPSREAELIRKELHFS
ncbi:MAG TPA: hypothetical protein VFP97_04560 [Chitinophagaceae bacterium]|nr:hypothetical protein [Chitinophagaceae bacterium]